MALTEILEVHTLRNMPLGLNEFGMSILKMLPQCYGELREKSFGPSWEVQGQGDVVVAARYFRGMDTIFHHRPSSSRPPGDTSPPVHPTDSLIFGLSRKIAFSEREGTHMTCPGSSLPG